MFSIQFSPGIMACQLAISTILSIGFGQVRRTVALPTMLQMQPLTDYHTYPYVQYLVESLNVRMP